jgi:hypothetical protein
MPSKQKKEPVIYKVSPQEWSFVHITNKIEKIGYKLEYLDLSGCSQTNDNLIKSIAPDLTKLYSLSLSGCIQLTDESVVEIAMNCPLLRELNLSECRLLTDDVIFAFSENCTKLTHVDLTGCPRITNESVCDLVMNNQSLLYLTPGYLRSIPQAEEIYPELDIRDQLDGR